MELFGHGSVLSKYFYSKRYDGIHIILVRNSSHIKLVTESGYSLLIWDTLSRGHQYTATVRFLVGYHKVANRF